MNQHIKLLGVQFELKYQRIEEWGYVANFNMDWSQLEHPADLDWTDLPQWPLMHREKPVLMFAIRYGDRWYHAEHLAELVELGKDFKFGKEKPNTAALREEERDLESNRSFFAEHLANVKAGRELILQFSYNNDKRSWQCRRKDREENMNIVCVVNDRRFIQRIEANPQAKWFCYQDGGPKTNNWPKNGRPGFRLVVVRWSMEYVDPDERIKDLRAKIAAGNP